LKNDDDARRTLKAGNDNRWIFSILTGRTGALMDGPVTAMHLNIEGVLLHIAESQARGTEKDAALLLLHGAGEDASVWDEQARYFAGRRLLFRLELPGHGQSGSSGEEHISAYTRWVRLVAGELFPSQPFVLAGHSMGGAIGLELATRPPVGMKGLVLIATGAKLGVTRAIFQMLTENPEAFFQSVAEFAFSPQAPQALRERLVRATRQCPPEVLLKDFRACDRFDIRDRLGDIRLPTLIMAGKDDQLTPVRYAKYLHQKIAGSHLALIPQAGHMVMAEQPALFNKALERFLGNGVE
jgi:pimeloyl-ACP methyl ester carboxylesterase